MLFFPFVFVLKLVMLCFLSFSSQCQTKTDYSVCDCWGMVPAQVAKEQENQCVMWWMSMLMKDSSDNPWLCEGCTFCWDVCMYLFLFLKLYRIGEELSSYFWKDASTVSNWRFLWLQPIVTAVENGWPGLWTKPGGYSFSFQKFYLPTLSFLKMLFCTCGLVLSLSFSQVFHSPSETEEMEEYCEFEQWGHGG